MPYRLIDKGNKITEKRSSPKRTIIYNPNLDLAKKSKIMPKELRGKESDYLHAYDLQKNKTLPNKHKLVFTCPKGHQFSPKILRNPIKCGRHNKIIGYI